MSVDTVLAAAQVLALVVGAGTIFVMLKGVRDQLRLQTFSEYTRRYGEIVRSLPGESRTVAGDFSLAALPADEQERVLNAARAYFNLCSEEFHLQRRGMIDGETWSIWQLGMRETMRLPWARESWRSVRAEYRYFDTFCEFVQDLMSAAEPPVRAVDEPAPYVAEPAQ